jgi:hypothetical protein
MQATKLIQISPSQNTAIKDKPIPKFTLTAPATTADSKPRDPLRMFGLLTPLPLKHAQIIAQKMVRDIIPQLVSIDAEMREQEICIRRARKRFLKTEKETKVAKIKTGGMDRKALEAR